MVRYHEVVSEPKGAFGESLVDQIRVITPEGYQIWRSGTGNGRQEGWTLYQSGQHTAGEIPLVAVYSNRIATLVSKPPLEECGNLAIAYCQRFTDYMHNVHCGALPILALKGFDPDNNDTELGISVNTAILLHRTEMPRSCRHRLIPTTLSWPVCRHWRSRSARWA